MFHSLLFPIAWTFKILNDAHTAESLVPARQPLWGISHWVTRSRFLG